MRRIITARNNTVLSLLRPNLPPKRQQWRNLPPLQHQLLWQKRRLQRRIPNRRRITITRSRRQRHPGVPVYRYELAKEYDVELDAVLTVLGYVYRGKLRLLPKAFTSAWTTLALMSLVDQWFMLPRLVNTCCRGSNGPISQLNSGDGRESPGECSSSRFGSRVDSHRLQVAVLLPHYSRRF
ncbi:hypothetical protein C1H46_022674 [Malus baccata]|uniref:Uncharacterized protein n=1 Tax=Malus baccata TaxID=106549 RepID=A0A540LZZ2_MALBA|nr:hypothetical protein C1H46_022674 [Malus baccata]